MILTVMLVFFLIGIAVQAATPDAFITKSHDSLPTSSMADVAYGNGVYMAVGSYGAIIRSADADTWVSVKTKSDSGSYSGVTNTESFSFGGVAFGNGLFVTGGSDGVLLTSPDGVAWTQRTSGTTNRISEVEYLTLNGSSAFYALTTGAILKSVDGITWTKVIPTGLPADKSLNEITVGNGGTRLAVGSAEGKIYHTTDGTYWSSIQPNASGGNNINLLRWMKDRYIISDSHSWIWSSEDLTSVSLVGSPFKQSASDTGIQMFSGFYDGSKYYLFGNASPYGHGAVYTSDDATNWTLQPYTHYFVAQNSVYVNGKYFRFGNEGLQVSPDGVNWSYKWGGIFNDIIYDGTRYIAVGKLGYEGSVWVSNDRINWSQRTMNERTGMFYAGAYGDGRYVAVGEYSNGRTALINSSNATEWTVNNSITDESILLDIAYGNGKFVAVGTVDWSEPIIKVSNNGGNTWNPVNLSGAVSVAGYTSVEFINNQFVAIGYSGTANSILTSTDGVTWTEHAGTYPNPLDCLQNMVYTNSKYIVLFWDSTYQFFIRTSTDLSTWSDAVAITGPYFNSFNYTSQIGKAGDNLYVLACDTSWNNVIMYSTDQGQTWQDSGMDTTQFTPYTVQTVGNNAVLLGDAKLFMTTNVIPVDSDSTVSAAGGITEPVSLPSTAASTGNAVDVFDFAITDSGASDGLSTDISQITLNTSGTGDFSKVTWRLSEPHASNVVGVYNSLDQTLRFGGLNISVADGESEIYTVSAYFNNNTGLTEGQTYGLSLNGSSTSCLTVSESGSQMATDQAVVSNGSGSAIDVTAAKLTYLTQPAGSVSGNVLITQPVVAATDAAGNIDTDFSGTITISANSSGSLTGNTKTAVAGIASFSNLIYNATYDLEFFNLIATSGFLPMAVSNSLASNVVATKLIFSTQPEPATGISGESLSFNPVPVVKAVDAKNLLDTGYGANISLQVVNSSGGGLDGSVTSLAALGDVDGVVTTVTIVPSGGVATFNGLALEYTAGGVSDTIALRASSGGLTLATSNPVTIHSLPRILSITPPTGRFYTAGENLEFEVRFSKDVNVTDNAGSVPCIRVDLNTGGTVSAYYIGGSGTDTLTFRYTVTEGVEDLDGITLVSPIILNGGTIQDASSNNAALTFDLPNTSGILVDSIAPAAPVVTSITQDRGISGSDGITNDQTLDISGTAEAFSTVTVYLNSLSIGSTTANAIGNWSFDNTASAISEGTHTITAKATDAAGNTGSISSGFSLVIDITMPAIPLITGISEDSGESSSDGITKDTSLMINGISSAGAYIEVFDQNMDYYGSTQADGSGSWSFDITSIPLNDGTYQFKAGASDEASNRSAHSAAYTVTVDTQAPTTTSVSINSGNPYTNSSLVTLNLNAVGASSMMISESSTFTGASYEPYAATKNFTLGNGDGTKTIYVKYIDVAGNETNAISDTIILDTVSPEVLISSTETDPTKNGNISVTIAFTESVSGFDAGDLSISNGSISHFSGSGATYTVDITALADGMVTVDIAGNAAQDDAGNGNTAAQQFSITVDTEEPSDGMITINDDAPYTNSTSVTLTLSATGATEMMISEDSAFAGASYELYATEKSFSLSSPDGTKTVYVKFKDSAGNETSSIISDSIVLDTIVPTTIITSGEGDPTGSESISVTITFSEDVTGFDATDLSVVNGTAVNFIGSGAVYTADIIPLSDGTVTANVNSDAAHDAAGNPNTADSYSFVSDRTLPGVTVSSTEGSSTRLAAIPLTITFSESVSGFDMH